MGLVNIDKEEILMQQNFQLLLGVPYSRVQMVGTIDGTNKVFSLPSPYYPIYSQGEANLTPGISDILVELGLTSGQTTTYTTAVASALESITDPATGESVMGGVTLATAPAVAAATSVVATGVEQMEPFLCQSFEPTIKQDNKAEGRLYSTQKLYGYGAIDIQLKSTMILTNHAVSQVVKKLFYQKYTGTGTVEPGYDASEFVPTPKPLYACMIIDDPNTGKILGVHKFAQAMATPAIPNIKDGNPGGFTLDLTVQANPVLLTPTTA